MGAMKEIEERDAQLWLLMGWFAWGRNVRFASWRGRNHASRWDGLYHIGRRLVWFTFLGTIQQIRRIRALAGMGM